MGLCKFLRHIFCRENEAVSRMDASSATEMPSNDAVPKVGLKVNTTSTQPTKSARGAPLPSSLHGERSDAHVQHQQDHDKSSSIKLSSSPEVVSPVQVQAKPTTTPLPSPANIIPPSPPLDGEQLEAPIERQEGDDESPAACVPSSAEVAVPPRGPQESPAAMLLPSSANTTPHPSLNSEQFDPTTERQEDDNGSPAASVPSNAGGEPPVGLQANPAARYLPSPVDITPPLPPLGGERFDPPIECQPVNAQNRVSRSPGKPALSPPTSLHIHAGQIQEGNFNHVGGDYFDNRVTHIYSSPDPGRDPVIEIENRRLLDELGKKSALGAVANAEERTYAPRCLRETRTRVLDDLGEWSAAEGRWKDARLLVLTGPAGHGKTAIMQSFSEKLLRESRETRVIVATFFFKATIPDQNQPKALVTTLAYQVAEHWQSFQANVVSVIGENARILSITLEHQMDHLLIGPIVRSQAAPPSPPVTVICAVDGLDECAGDDNQSRVIRLLHTLSMVPNTRVVLASRPEFPIQSALEASPSGTLHIDLNTVYDASKDIRQFTWIRLLEIRDRLLPKIDRVSWPREADAEQIADYSSGQFILADTAMRYIDDRHCDPRKRLEEVLDLCGGANVPRTTRPGTAGRGSTRPLGVLDALFTGILERAARNAYHDLEPERAVLELASLVWILIRLVPSRVEAAGGSSQAYISLWIIEEALDRQSGELARELSDLHSLLEVPQDMCGRNKISAHHKSFLDFLGNRARSGHLGNIPQVAEERFDMRITTHVSSLTAEDLKNIVSAQSVKPHILHHLHMLWKPKTVLEAIDPEVWKTLLPSLNAWDTLLLKEWVFMGLTEGPLRQKLENSKALRMMDEACKRNLHHSLLPGHEHEGPANTPLIADIDAKLLLATLDIQGGISGWENFAFIPQRRTTPDDLLASPFFPWFPAACTLAWLWAPSHRLTTNRSTVIEAPSCIVFIVGSAGSGKQELLAEAYGRLPAGRRGGPPEGWMPPVDIIMVPDKDGLSLRLLWTQGSFCQGNSTSASCHNEDLTREIKLSALQGIPMSLFQDCITSWRAKHERNTYHPQFLLQGLHLFSPEHQATLLDMISSDLGQSGSTVRPPLFITVTSLPTTTFASRLRQFSGPGLYYFNLDGMKADVSLLEAVLVQWVEVTPLMSATMPLSKLRRMAHILAASPKPARHLKKLMDHQKRVWYGQWEKELNLILVVPEIEAWELIEHLGEISSNVQVEHGGIGEGKDGNWEDDGDQSSDDCDESDEFYEGWGAVGNISGGGAEGLDEDDGDMEVNGL